MDKQEQLTYKNGLIAKQEVSNQQKIIQLVWPLKLKVNGFVAGNGVVVVVVTIVAVVFLSTIWTAFSVRTADKILGV